MIANQSKSVYGFLFVKQIRQRKNHRDDSYAGSDDIDENEKYARQTSRSVFCSFYLCSVCSYSMYRTTHISKQSISLFTSVVRCDWFLLLNVF